MSHTNFKQFETSKKIPNIRSHHKFLPQNSAYIRRYVYSNCKYCSDYYSVTTLTNCQILSVKTNVAVACVYDGNYWIGNVEDESEETIIS